MTILIANFSVSTKLTRTKFTNNKNCKLTWTKISTMKHYTEALSATNKDGLMGNICHGIRSKKKHMPWDFGFKI